MTKLIICFVCLLSSVFVFLASLIKLLLWLKIFYGQEAGGGDGEGVGSVLGMPHRVLLCFKRKPRHKSSFWFGLSNTSVMSPKTQLFPSLYCFVLMSSVAFLWLASELWLSSFICEGEDRCLLRTKKTS